jgi:hypothetical protein
LNDLYVVPTATMSVLTTVSGHVNGEIMKMGIFQEKLDGPSNERCRKEGEEMDAGETRQGQMEIYL